jgi:hypothetical protein
MRSAGTQPYGDGREALSSLPALMPELLGINLRRSEGLSTPDAS